MHSQDTGTRIPCAHCGQSFRISCDRHLYCSRACYTAAIRARVEANGPYRRAFKMTAKAETRFLVSFAKSPEPDGCWEWARGRNRAGYGKFFAGGEIPAHRFSYLLFVGPIPDGLVVCHRCDNPPCVRPDHLFLGTKGDNNRDSWSKGRHSPLRGVDHWMHKHPERILRGDALKMLRTSPPLRGEAHGCAKLTWPQVRAIRTAAAAGQARASLAREYGMHPGTIRDIVRDKIWKE